MSQAKRWCFTLNNYTQDEDDAIAALLQHPDIRYGGYGREVGNAGTPHLQGWFCLHHPKRLNQIKRWRPAAADPNVVPAPLGRAHLSIMRGSVPHNVTYCSKDGDYQQFGEPIAAQSSNSTTALDEILTWGDQFIEDNGRAPTKRELAIHQPKALIQYKNVYETFKLRAPAPVLREGTPREWQQTLSDALDEECEDDRSILFYVDSTGGTGKSWFQQWYFSRNPERVQILGAGRLTDLAYAIDEMKTVFFFNVPRGGMEFFSYRLAESLKDRMVFSAKYESSMKMLDKCPHVVVFCNEDPDMTALSDDRYKIITL